MTTNCSKFTSELEDIERVGDIGVLFIVALTLPTAVTVRAVV